MLNVKLSCSSRIRAVMARQVSRAIALLISRLLATTIAAFRPGLLIDGRDHNGNAQSFARTAQSDAANGRGAKIIETYAGTNMRFRGADTVG